MTTEFVSEEEYRREKEKQRAWERLVALPLSEGSPFPPTGLHPFWGFSPEGLHPAPGFTVTTEFVSEEEYRREKEKQQARERWEELPSLQRVTPAHF